MSASPLLPLSEASPSSPPPGAELVLMPGTGHFAKFKQPEEINQILMDDLAS
ncbi:MAG: hypothetical protein KY456_16920 [Chloroflexi bacterium]|nr:hypothetical protein [Chloroflexota bacterium]